MAQYDPGYRGECNDVVADYDYELGLLSRDAQSRHVQETAPIEEQNDQYSNRHPIALIVGLVVVVAIAGAFFVGMRTGAHQPPVSAMDDQSGWVDSLEPISPPSVVEPSPSPSPHGDPAPGPRPIPPPRCADSESRPSYKAVKASYGEVAAAWSVLAPPGAPLFWPSPQPGFTWVVGPEDRVPVGVEDERVDWWWNWQVDSTGCGDYRLDEYRLR